MDEQESSVFMLDSNNNGTNNTSTTVSLIKYHHEILLELYKYLVPPLGCFIILINLAVVISSGLILKKGTKPRPTYLFLGNIAMSDLVMGISIVLGKILGSSFPKEDRSRSICSIFLGMIVCSTFVSIYSVGLIAVDRYMFIIHGLKYQRKLDSRRARILIGATWFLGIIIGFLPLMIEDKYDPRFCWFVKLASPKFLATISIICLFPIILVIILYSIILYNAIKKVTQLQNADKLNDQVPNLDNELRIFRGRSVVLKDAVQEEKPGFINKVFRKQDNVDNEPTKSRAVKIVVFTTGSFVITWVPYIVACWMLAHCNRSETRERCLNIQVFLAGPLATLGFMNSLLNPIIYAWWHRGFREFIKKCLSKKVPQGLPTPKKKNPSSSRNVTSKKSSSQTCKISDGSIR